MKVLFVTQYDLFHYRLPIFSIVNSQKDIELTLAHCGNKVKQNNIPEILLERRKVGPIYWFKNFNRIYKEYDIVLSMAYLQNLSILRMLLKWRRNYKVVFWSIGVRASTAPGHGFDSKSRLEKFKEFFYKKADALLFYSSYPIAKHEKYGVPREKMFVANNTVQVIKTEIFDNQSRNQFLFVGTLYKTKGLDKLLNAYAQACKECSGIYKLTIVGDGDLAYYKQMVKALQLENKVTLTGGIYDEDQLSQQFLCSILCISPNQAGLTVLKSLGYGVPFVTASDAITGGERLNVIEGETGFYCNTQEEITNIMVDSFKDPQKYRTIGRNAYDYYWKNRTPEIMAQGIIDAIRFVK